MYTKKQLLEKIDNNLSKIKNLRPLSKTELNELKKSLWVMFTYSSNAIEWNTLTLWETKLILEDGITIWGKTLREINEASNHKWILEFLYEYLNWKISFDTELIKKIHYLVLRNIDDENAWKYRKIQCYISWDEKLPPDANKLDSLMNELVVWYSYNEDNLHPSILASEFHYKFVKIHPFIDWNGRTIRVLLNMILMKKWYPMIVIPPIRRQEYISTLNSANSIENFEIFMLDVINVNLEDYLRMVES